MVKHEYSCSARGTKCMRVCACMADGGRRATCDSGYVASYSCMQLKAVVEVRQCMHVRVHAWHACNVGDHVECMYKPDSSN
jgi:hypothetical protein